MNATEFIRRKKAERHLNRKATYAKYPSGGRAKITKAVYFYEGDDDMREIYDAISEICPSRTSSGPNISDYLRSHKDQILAEAEAKKAA